VIYCDLVALIVHKSAGFSQQAQVIGVILAVESKVSLEIPLSHVLRADPGSLVTEILRPKGVRQFSLVTCFMAY
jgi:hypothetical protein